YHLQTGVLHDTAFLSADFAFFDGAGGGSTDMERTHRQLRARLADALGGDDAHGHAFFDHRAGRQVHAVAAPANAQRCVARHRAADLNLLQAQLFDATRDDGRNQLIFANDHFVGDRVDDVRAADAATNRVG